MKLKQVALPIIASVVVATFFILNYSDIELPSIGIGDGVSGMVEYNTVERYQSHTGESTLEKYQRMHDDRGNTVTTSGNIKKLRQKQEIKNLVEEANLNIQRNWCVRYCDGRNQTYDFNTVTKDCTCSE